jgi:hypothetical protein
MTPHDLWLADLANWFTTAARSAGRPELTPEARLRTRKALRRVLVSPPELTAHLRALRGLAGPRPDLAQVTGWYPHVLAGGLRQLDDLALATLALSPGGLWALAQAIAQESPAAWRAGLRKARLALLHRHGFRTRDLLPPAVPTGKQGTGAESDVEAGMLVALSEPSASAPPRDGVPASHALVQDCLRRLPLQQRRLLLLHFHHRLSDADIGALEFDLDGASPQALGQRAYRLRLQAQAALTELLRAAGLGQDAWPQDWANA